MQIELRAFHHYARMSEETDAFDADIYVDGRKAGTVRNSGRGEGNYPHWDDQALGKRIEDHVKSLPPKKTEYGELAMDIDFFISLEVESMLIRKQAQGLLARNQVFLNEKGQLIKGKKGVTYRLKPGQRQITDVIELAALLKNQRG